MSHLPLEIFLYEKDVTNKRHHENSRGSRSIGQPGGFVQRFEPKFY